MASKVKFPHGAPRIRDRFVEREVIVGLACERLGVGGSKTDDSRGPRIVGLAGSGGAGKSTVASIVIAREDVRASFHNGVLWLPVGRGAKKRLPALMFDLAKMVNKNVMMKSCRPPAREGTGDAFEDEAQYSGHGR